MTAHLFSLGLRGPSHSPDFGVGPARCLSSIMVTAVLLLWETRPWWALWLPFTRLQKCPFLPTYKEWSL